MQILLAWQALICLSSLQAAVAHSQYDNPEQDPGYGQTVFEQQNNLDWSKEELERRWGQDVSPFTLFSV
jgi:hypothetical protein